MVTGGSGLLGRAIVRNFKEAGWDVIGTAFSRAREGFVKLDLTKFDEAYETIIGTKAQVIIHAAAERRPDVAEKDPEGTIRLNVEACATVARAAKELGAHLIYISSDSVFDGTAPPYKPESKTNPLNLYAKSKLHGEEAVLAGNPGKTAILRIPLLYGPIEKLDECSLTALASDVLVACDPARNGIKLIEHWTMRNPTHVDDVAQILRGLVTSATTAAAAATTTSSTTSVASDAASSASAAVGSFKRAIYHFGAPGQFMTKHGIAVHIAQALGLDKSRLRPDASEPKGAARPKDPSLDSSLLAEDGIELGRPALQLSETIRDLIWPFVGQQVEHFQHHQHRSAQ